MDYFDALKANLKSGRLRVIDGKEIIYHSTERVVLNTNGSLPDMNINGLFRLKVDGMDYKLLFYPHGKQYKHTQFTIASGNIEQELETV